MVRFDLGALLQGQTRIAKIKSAYNSLIIGPRVLQCDLGSSFKVKRLLIGFSELSFWWIQFASVFQCARSSFCCILFLVDRLIIFIILLLKNCAFY